MEKELNLVEILKNAPKGTKLYSPICGECKLKEIDHGATNHPIVVSRSNGERFTFTKEGYWFNDLGDCVLFPSKDNRDWSTFKVEEEGFKVGDHIKHKNTGGVCVLTQKAQNREGFWAKKIICPFDDCNVYISEHEFGSYEKVDKFNPNWLKPFDRVIMYDDGCCKWFATLFSHYNKDANYPYSVSDGCRYTSCVPYNDETKYLIGTKEEEPEFYKID